MFMLALSGCWFSVSRIRRCSWWFMRRWRWLLARLSGTSMILRSVLRWRVVVSEVLDDVIGMFVNTLVLRTESRSGCCSVQSICWQVSREADLGRRSGMRMCRSSGWWRCSIRSGRRRGSPLFQVMLVVPEHGAVGLSSSSDLTACWCRMRGSELSAKFDLQLDRWWSRHDDAGAAAGITGVVDVCDGSVRRVDRCLIC